MGAIQQQYDDGAPSEFPNRRRTYLFRMELPLKPIAERKWIRRTVENENEVIFLF